MNRLLSANFARLWKNKVFWFGTAVMFIWASLLLIADYRTISTVPEYINTLDDYFFKYAPVIGGLCAVFISLFIGTDYSDGAIRNKITVGHSRKAIYLSNMIVGAAAVIVMNAAYILAVLAVGVPLFGWPESGVLDILAYLLITLFMIVAFVSIFTLTSMLNQNKASAVVTSFLVFLAILFLAGYCYGRLNEPEMTSGGIVITSDGNTQFSSYSSEPSPNPYYISGNIRVIYEFLRDFLPTGQGILMSGMEVTHPPLMLLYSLIVITVTTIVGIFIFKRKNLR
jgi:hypothetical protein